MAATTSRARIGLGTQIVFTQSQFAGEIIEQITFGTERDDIDVTHMGVPPVEPGGPITNRQKIPLEISGISDMNFTVHLDEEAGWPPVNGQPETIEIIFRRRKTQATAAKFSATGWVKTVNATLPLEGKMTMALTVGFTGDLLFTRATALA
jgi:hypothetical protein